jgi:hypothetical protein
MPVVRPEASAGERMEQNTVFSTDTESNASATGERVRPVEEPVSNWKKAENQGKAPASIPWVSEPPPVNTYREPSYFSRFSERSLVATASNHWLEKKANDPSDLEPVDAGRAFPDSALETQSSREQKERKFIVKEAAIQPGERVIRERFNGPEKEDSSGVQDLFKSGIEPRSTVQVRPVETEAAYPATAGKKAPAPAKLVIGRIVVEVVNPPPAIQTIRRPGPAPAGSSSQPGNGSTHKLSFGLGQL